MRAAVFIYDEVYEARYADLRDVLLETQVRQNGNSGEEEEKAT